MNLAIHPVSSKGKPMTEQSPTVAKMVEELISMISNPTYKAQHLNPVIEGIPWDQVTPEQVVTVIGLYKQHCKTAHPPYLKLERLGAPMPKEHQTGALNGSARSSFPAGSGDQTRWNGYYERM